MTPVRARMIAATFALGMVAGGVALLVHAVDQERQTAHLRAVGVRTEARIIDETLHRRGPGIVDVRFEDEQGRTHDATFEVPAASAWRAGDRTIDVVYDPEKPGASAVSASGGLRRPWLPIFGGFVLVGAGLASAWALVRAARRPRGTAADDDGRAT